MDIRTVVRLIAVLIGIAVIGLGSYFLIAKKNKVGIIIVIAGIIMIVQNVLALLVY